MNTSISELIAEKIDAMPASERKAAQTLVGNYPLIGLRTVAEFSAQAGVSSPTILRFVSRLGFQSYPEFQGALQEELAAQVQSPWNRAATIGAGGSAMPFPLMESAIENIRETFQHISQRQLGEAASALARSKARLYLLGGRFTDPIANYMASHLKIVRPGVTHLFGQESHWRDQLIDMGKKDVLVIFDIRRYQDSLLRFAEKAQQRGVEIVLITDQWLSPIARFARHVIAGRTAVPSPWDSSAALFLVAETLIADVTRRLEQTGADRIRDLEQLRDR
ncbi:MurR/RpiR family transcriptional regulator [Phyllobacterium sp. 21LDTY02-6]|uniref:MurR/RpiR family transcriptional regulator n=1 Tax=unclassified Phyllobacterium TaxID=2638441 RepID=UPI0020216E4A|nr:MULTISPECIES: MurR/RpiR family transcriptional regulator [unclassified Phyllobacterium]MCO4315694.1 MurR/RpiR family transcriptional regulator [Phyllobacterium sp. 21LDTY02-6]MCX8280894.1 MurR/RpiR family transcriptional regulator [Phyllobacterium sp. 0TCS1.6C]MCX8295760.1 MurR/RpiR family transcriptional regulator [Phyllobacterium sp. 0TCS1.6A]